MNIFLQMSKAIDGTGTFAFMLFLLTVLLFAFMLYMIMYVIGTRHFIKMIGKMHTCNDCGRKQCEYRPAWGDHVRYNCPFWEETTTWPDRHTPDDGFCYDAEPRKKDDDKANRC